VDPKFTHRLRSGKRWLIVPEHNNVAISDRRDPTNAAQRSGAYGNIDYENAPVGREVHSASLYHWWLGLMPGSTI